MNYRILALMCLIPISSFCMESSEEVGTDVEELVNEMEEESLSLTTPRDEGKGKEEEKQTDDEQRATMLERSPLIKDDYLAPSTASNIEEDDENGVEPELFDAKKTYEFFTKEDVDEAEGLELCEKQERFLEGKARNILGLADKKARLEEQKAANAKTGREIDKKMDEVDEKSNMETEDSKKAIYNEILKYYGNEEYIKQYGEDRTKLTEAKREVARGYIKDFPDLDAAVRQFVRDQQGTGWFTSLYGWVSWKNCVVM